MSALTISNPVTLACSECAEGEYHATDANGVYAACNRCENTVHVRWDVARYLDHNERIVWLGTLLAYFTEEEVEEEGIDY